MPRLVASFGILALASIASAFPLRPGVTATYQVWRGWRDTLSQVKISVLRSAATDSGAIWTLALRDSASGGVVLRDTATLLQSGIDRRWIRASALAAFEPAPLDSAASSRRVAPTLENRDALWGTTVSKCFRAIGRAPTRWPASLACEVNRGWEVDLSEQGGSWVRGWSDYPAHLRASLPHGQWRPGLGWLRWRDAWLGESWELLDTSGIPLPKAVATDSLHRLPRAGDRWTWERTATERRALTAFPNTRFDTAITTSFVAWQVVASLGDSAGFRRWEVVERDSGSVVRERRFVLAASVFRAQVVPDTLPAQGLLGLWSDSREALDRTQRTHFEFRRVSLISLTESSRRNSLFLRPGIGLDSARQERRQVFCETTRPLVCPTDLTRTEDWRLLSFNDQALRRTSGLSPRRAAVSVAWTLDGVRQRLADPSARLHLTLLDGRLRRLDAATWERERTALHGVVVLTIEREGVRETGRLLLP